MIKPPFTLIVIKDTHHPVTVRVTTNLLFLSVMVFIAAGAVAGFSGTYMVMRKSQHVTTSKGKTVKPPVPSENTTNQNTTKKPNIENLELKNLKNESVEITLAFSSMPVDSEVYIWLIINPKADIASERLVFPRSPIFRGLPVDYRNGITHLPSKDNTVKVSLSDEINDINDINVQQYRILVYSVDGTIILDKLLDTGQTT